MAILRKHIRASPVTKHAYLVIPSPLAWVRIHCEGGRFYVEVHEARLVDVGREGDGDFWIRRSGAGGRGPPLALRVQMKDKAHYIF